MNGTSALYWPFRAMKIKNYIKFEKSILIKYMYMIAGNSFSAALADLSARSLPWIPTWLGTQLNLTYLCTNPECFSGNKKDPIRLEMKWNDGVLGLFCAHCLG